MSVSPDYTRFCDALKADAPPAEVSAELRALWWTHNGGWDRAHQIVQDLDTVAAARVHAYLHRVEGDLENADYWYRRAGAMRTNQPLQVEWASLATQLLNQASAD
jgi:hypothetical protein